MIYIVRHGQTNWNLEGRCQGRTDTELNETGIEQAEKIRKQLEGIKFDKIFSSPLKRAYKTAQIICNNEPIIQDERLVERCNGELEGKLISECECIPDFTDPNDTRFGIEPLQIFKERIADFLNEIIKKCKEENIFISTHGGVSIYARCYFEGEPEDGNYKKYKLKNCEVLRYENNK